MTYLAHLFPHVHSLFEQGVDAGLHTGAQLYVALEGQVVVDEGLGEARDGIPMTRDSITLWRSSVKPITAVAVAQLVESGAISLTDRIASVLPAFAEGGKQDITLEQVLTHTGGFRTADVEWNEETWPESVERVCQAPLENGWTPGAKAGYHTEGAWIVLGAVVEQLTEQRFQEVMAERIFQPAGMEEAWIGLPENLDAEHMRRVALMYTLKPDGLALHPIANTEIARQQIRPGSNGYGPIRELGHFYEALLEDGCLIQADTLRDWTARRREGMFDETLRHVMDWGLAFMPNNNRYGAETVPYGFGRHASPLAFGHGGAQSSTAFADPEYGLVVALIFNGMPGELRHQKRMRAMLSAIYQDLKLAK